MHNFQKYDHSVIHASLLQSTSLKVFQHPCNAAGVVMTVLN